MYEVEPCELHVKRWVNNDIIGAYHLVYHNIEHFKPIGTHRNRSEIQHAQHQITIYDSSILLRTQ